MATIVEPTEKIIKEAASRLADGELVAFPTETVYGLGADATNDRAVAEIFETKKRPSFNPLICHFANVDKVSSEVDLPGTASALIDAFWPGGLTLVLPRREDSSVSRLASAGLDTLAVRVPDHPVASSLLAAIGRPIAAPSANRSGRLSPTTARHVMRSLGDEDVMIIDGGPCEIGLESTVVAIDPSGALTLLREGAVSREAIETRANSHILEATDCDDQPASPGMLAKHYGARVPLRVDAEKADEDEILLCFGPLPTDAPTGSKSLSPSRDFREAAANLFAMLHEAEESGCRAIAVTPIPDMGLGRAINDRLRRGAANGA